MKQLKQLAQGQVELTLRPIAHRSPCAGQQQACSCHYHCTFQQAASHCAQVTCSSARRSSPAAVKQFRDLPNTEQTLCLLCMLQDDDPYVRKTAAVCVAKLFDINPELVEDRGFLDMLRVRRQHSSWLRLDDPLLHCACASTASAQLSSALQSPICTHAATSSGAGMWMIKAPKASFCTLCWPPAGHAV